MGARKLPLVVKGEIAGGAAVVEKGDVLVVGGRMAGGAAVVEGGDILGMNTLGIRSRGPAGCCLA